MAVTAWMAAATACSDDALTVASTRALMAAASIVAAADVVDELLDGKKASSVSVGDGEGVLRSLLALMRA